MVSGSELVQMADLPAGSTSTTLPPEQRTEFTPEERTAFLDWSERIDRKLAELEASADRTLILMGRKNPT